MRRKIRQDPAHGHPSLSAVLVIAGLIYALGNAGRSQAALAAAGCEPGLSSNSAPCITQPMLASEYMAILTPATQQQNVDMAAYTASERGISPWQKRPSRRK